MREVGYVFPEGELPLVWNRVGSPLEDFRKVTRIPLQAVWGDSIDKSEIYSARLEQTKQFVEVVNKYGGKAEILMLRDGGAHARRASQRLKRVFAIEVERCQRCGGRLTIIASIAAFPGLDLRGPSDSNP